MLKGTLTYLADRLVLVLILFMMLKAIQADPGNILTRSRDLLNIANPFAEIISALK